MDAAAASADANAAFQALTQKTPKNKAFAVALTTVTHIDILVDDQAGGEQLQIQGEKRRLGQEQRRGTAAERPELRGVDHRLRCLHLLLRRSRHEQLPSHGHISYFLFRLRILSLLILIGSLRLFTTFLTPLMHWART